MKKMFEATNKQKNVNMVIMERITCLHCDLSRLNVENYRSEETRRQRHRVLQRRPAELELEKRHPRPPISMESKGVRDKRPRSPTFSPEWTRKRTKRMRKEKEEEEAVAEAQAAPRSPAAP